jgi:hypothetical protein
MEKNDDQDATEVSFFASAREEVYGLFGWVVAEASTPIRMESTQSVVT